MVVCKNWPKYYNMKTAKSSTHPLRLGNDRLQNFMNFSFGFCFVLSTVGSVFKNLEVLVSVSTYQNRGSVSVS